MSDNPLPCCADCGEELEDAARLKVCPYCGAVLETVSAQEFASGSFAEAPDFGEPVHVPRQVPPDLPETHARAFARDLGAARLAQWSLVAAIGLAVVDAVLLSDISLRTTQGRMTFQVLLLSLTLYQTRTSLARGLHVGSILGILASIIFTLRVIVVLNRHGFIVAAIAGFFAAAVITLAILVRRGARAARRLEHFERERLGQQARKNNQLPAKPESSAEGP